MATIATNKAPFEGDTRHADMLTVIRRTADLMSNPRQACYWRGLASCARPVRVVSAYDVWPKAQVDMLRAAIRPAKRECYRTAFMLADLTGGRARYVEGQMWACVLGVDHAFNYIPERDVYVDFTAEFALGNDPAKEAYIAFRDFDLEQVMQIIVKNEYYGNIYNEVWLQENKG